MLCVAARRPLSLMSVLDGGEKVEEQHALYTRTQNTH